MPSDFHSFSDDTTDSYDLAVSNLHDADEEAAAGETPTMQL